MAATLTIVCPHCDTQNRVPRSRLSDGGHCGACKKLLFDGKPIVLNQQRFTQHSAKGDIPLLIDFWASWCGPCKMMAPEFEKAAAIIEPEARLAKIDVDAEQALASQYRIQSIPTLVLVHKGKELARSSGAMSARDLVQWFQAHQQPVSAG